MGLQNNKDLLPNVMGKIDLHAEWFNNTAHLADY